MSTPWTFLEVADRIGARLCRDPLWSNGCCNWLGAGSGDAEASYYSMLSPNLYKGTSGIGLFLGRLFAVTGEKVFLKTARGALRQAVTHNSEILDPLRCGLYTGLPGIAYACECFSQSTGEQEFRDRALGLMEDLAAVGVKPRSVDVISGSAGLIAASLYLHRKLAAGWLLDLARRHGEWLLDSALPTEDGLSWDTGVSSALRHLTGFAHGAAGIAWALAELFHSTGDSRFRTAAQEGFRYERSCFHSELGWPDFRKDPPEYPEWWCHGAAGIGFSRLRAWQILGDEVYRKEAEWALQATEKRFSDPDFTYSLCHGRCGNAELFLYASEVLGDVTHREWTERVATEGMERYEKTKTSWPSGLPDGSETPGLLLGLAGIGHFYLRVADPLRTSSVLLIT